MLPRAASFHQKNENEKNSGHMIKCLLVGPDGKIFVSRSKRTCPDLERNIFPSSPLTQSISTWYSGKLFLCVYITAMDDQSYLHIFPCIRNIKSFIYPVAFFTIYGYITNSQHHQLSVGLKGHLLEHCIGIAEVIVSNFVHSAIFLKVVQ